MPALKGDRESREGLKGYVLGSLRMARAVSSINPIVSATALFLMMLRNSEVSGGRMMR